MRQLNVLILALIIGLLGAANAQNKVSLTFTGEIYDSIYQKLDSVKITNITRGWTEILTGDTVLVLNDATGITESINSQSDLSLNLTKMNANGVELALSLPENSSVVLELYDITGRQITKESQKLGQGVHAFSIAMPSSQVYIFRAITSCGAVS